MLRKIRLVGIFCAVIIAVIFFSWLRSQYMVPIIMYHSVTPQARIDNRVEVSASRFQYQMEFLKNHHYNIVSLEEAGKMIKERKRVPAKTIAITFDDGYEDNYIYAYPVLKRLKIPATIFIIVNEVDRSNGDRLNWNQIKEMQGSGLISFGSHTLDHFYLPEVKSEEELIRQIFGSKISLEEKLGVPINTFCYPAGRFNLHIKDLVAQAGYKYAFATGLGRKYSNQDVYLIERVRVSESDNLFELWAKISGYYNTFRTHNNR
ncbi:MAG: polysaccharide deacetylase family protein [Candidatus Omnitrophota bacterium]|nr:polysaccharide deacetylase family protein [Candidatus Omnitrophota bacterium]